MFTSTQLRAQMECLEQLTPRTGPEYLVRYENDIIYSMEPITLQTFCINIANTEKKEITREFIVGKPLILETNIYHGIVVYHGVGIVSI